MILKRNKFYVFLFFHVFNTYFHDFYLVNQKSECITMGFVKKYVNENQFSFVD